MDANGYTLGGAWITDNNRVALSYGRMDSEYGIVGEEGVYIKLQQDRYQGVVRLEKSRQFFLPLCIGKTLILITSIPNLMVIKLVPLLKMNPWNPDYGLNMLCWPWLGKV